MEQLIIPAIIAIVVAFFSVYGLTPIVIKALEKRKVTVVDVNKKEKTMVARPGGLSIIVGMELSLIILYAFFPISEILAVILTTFFAFIVGIIDDKKTMGGWFKPIALAFCSAPILLLGAYDSNLTFPLFGTVICLKKAGVPLLGAIHQPTMKLLVIGDGDQTTLNDRLVKVRNTKELCHSTILTTDDLDARRRFGKDNWENLVKKAALYRTWGDCFGYLSLASGNADVMIDPIVNPWDFHAMIPIVQGAGGMITDHEGNDPLKGNSVIACHHELHALILDQLAG